MTLSAFFKTGILAQVLNTVKNDNTEVDTTQSNLAILVGQLTAARDEYESLLQTEKKKKINLQIDYIQQITDIKTREQNENMLHKAEIILLNELLLSDADNDDNIHVNEQYSEISRELNKLRTQRDVLYAKEILAKYPLENLPTTKKPTPFEKIKKNQSLLESLNEIISKKQNDAYTRDSKYQNLVDIMSFNDVEGPDINYIKYIVNTFPTLNNVEDPDFEKNFSNIVDNLYLGPQTEGRDLNFWSPDFQAEIDKTDIALPKRFNQKLVKTAPKRKTQEDTAPLPFDELQKNISLLQDLKDIYKTTKEPQGGNPNFDINALKIIMSNQKIKSGQKGITKNGLGIAPGVNGINYIQFLVNEFPSLKTVPKETKNQHDEEAGSNIETSNQQYKEQYQEYINNFTKILEELFLGPKADGRTGWSDKFQEMIGKTDIVLPKTYGRKLVIFPEKK